MAESWEENAKLVLKTLDELKAEQEKTNDKLEAVGKEVALQRFKLYLIGTIASLVGGALASAITTYLFKTILKS